MTQQQIDIIWQDAMPQDQAAGGGLLDRLGAEVAVIAHRLRIGIETAIARLGLLQPCHRPRAEHAVAPHGGAGVHLAAIEHEDAGHLFEPSALTQEYLDRFGRAQQGEIVEGDPRLQVVGGIAEAAEQFGPVERRVVDGAAGHLFDADEADGGGQIEGQGPVIHRFDGADVVVDGAGFVTALDHLGFGQLQVFGLEGGAVDVAEDRPKAVQVALVAGLAIAAVFQTLGRQKLLGDVVDGVKLLGTALATVFIFLSTPTGPGFDAAVVENFGGGTVFTEVVIFAAPAGEPLTGGVFSELWNPHGGRDCKVAV